MKLFYAGVIKQDGFEELKPPGLSLGRELDNDIVLDEEAASRYHCKMFFRDDNWFLKDLGSTNGTKLNGLKIKEEIKLTPGDEISIGHQKFVFAETLDKTKSEHVPSPSQNKPDEAKKAIDPKELDALPKENVKKAFFSFFSEKKAPEEKPKNAASDTAPSFFKKPKPEELGDTAPKKKRLSVTFYIILVLTAVIIIGGFLLIEKILEKKPPAPAPKPAHIVGAPLTVIYEKQICTPDNIFRYELTIKNNTITVTRDDIKYNLRFKRQQTVDEKLIEDLIQEIKDTEFMTLAEQQTGISPDNTDECKILTVLYGRTLNSVRIKNTFEPPQFKDAVNVIENLSNEILNIPTISRTPDEMKKEAEKAFEKAEMLFANRQANAENIREAARRYGYVIELLECFEPKPEMYDKAYSQGQEAKKIIEDEVKRHEVNAQQFSRLNKIEDTIEEYKEIIELLEPNDKRAQKAKERIIQMEKFLRSRSKGK
jgi:pSer/pThr/pTyr-binding forkhead associated (FHA) protein